MGLFQRLTGEEQPKISVHAFMAGVSEIARGVFTVNQAASVLQLDATETTQLSTYMSVVATKGTLVNQLLYIHETEQVLLIAEAGWAYTSGAAAMQRLGL